MLSDTTLMVLIALALANLALLGWLLVQLKAGLAGRFDGIDRNEEALRRALAEMDQGLRREIADGARDGLAAAFDKVQQGSKAQAEGLAHVQQALNQLSDTMRGAFDGFSQRLRDEQEQLRGNV